MTPRSSACSSPSCSCWRPPRRPHWRYFGRDAGRSGLQQVDEGGSPLSFSYPLTRASPRDTVTSFTPTVGGGPRRTTLDNTTAGPRDPVFGTVTRTMDANATIPTFLNLRNSGGAPTPQVALATREATAETFTPSNLSRGPVSQRLRPAPTLPLDPGPITQSAGRAGPPRAHPPEGRVGC